jgi:hypothetical protein
LPLAALKVAEANEEPRDEARPEMDPDELDALAVALERSASWFPAPTAPEPASASQSADGPASERDPNAAPESRVRASSRPLSKQERRELSRKQHALAAQRANEERRARQRKRKENRAQRLAARKQAALPKIAAVKVAPRAARIETAEPEQPSQPARRLPRLLAWLLRKKD